MGYYSAISGSWQIRPRLPEDAIDELHLDGESDAGATFVAISEGEEDSVELVNNEITVVPGDSWTQIECRYEEPIKAYGLGEELDEIVKAAHKAGCTIEGAIYVSGEESPDFSRWRVEDGALLEERPEFLWPNGDKGWE